MVQTRPACLARTARALCLVAVAFSATAIVNVRAEKPSGRFLFAGDDDWDWATPLDAAELSKLARYGEMPWSALDWAEDGLKEVRGVLLGSPPSAKKTFTMEQLSELRGENATYRHLDQAPGALEKLMKEEKAPNVIILMQNTAKSNALTKEDIGLLTKFVKTGGRVVTLDDWGRYRAVLDAVVKESLKLPPGPAIPEPPAPAPLKPTERPKPPEQPKEDLSELKKKLDELLPGLGDEKFSKREEASAGIIELGPKVLQLFDDVETADPEVKSRLKDLREKLTPKKPKSAISQEERDARRAAKYAANAEVVRSAAKKLRNARIPHLMSDALVDMEKRPLPTLRIEFPQ